MQIANTERFGVFSFVFVVAVVMGWHEAVCGPTEGNTSPRIPISYCHPANINYFPTPTQWGSPFGSFVAVERHVITERRIVRTG